MADKPKPPLDIKAIFDLPPEQAIAFLDSKAEYRISLDWTDTFNEEHDAAFTVAKIAKVDLLRDIHVSLLDAMAQGKPFEQWRAELEPTLRDKGWLGKVQNEDVTGTADAVMVGPRRLRTIYGTNLRSARSVGLWQRIQANKEALPFLAYSAVRDLRTRPQHALWGGLLPGTTRIILPVDHPWWLTHFPPNGWNCRCTVIQLSQRDLDRRGWTVTLDPPTIDLVPFRRKGGGLVYQVPRGIDPGFGYNAGAARLQAVADKVAQSLVQAHAEQLPGATSADTVREILGEVPAARLSADVIDAIARLIVAGEIDALAAMVAELLG